jgi:hypothetical protein
VDQDGTTHFVAPLDPNGIEFDRGDLFVANTDQGTIVRVKLGDGRCPPHAEVFVQSSQLFGADGVSFDVKHNLYVTNDYINTLVWVGPAGDIQTIATSTDGLDFLADTYFAQKHGQRKFLFWTNGGYNFNLPSLQKMDVGIPGGTAAVRCAISRHTLRTALKVDFAAL